MAKKQQPTTSHRRTREELVIDTFRYMIRNGEAVRKEVTVLLATGGTMTKVIYKVEPNSRK
jgi:hypothetical protein